MLPFVAMLLLPLDSTSRLICCASKTDSNPREKLIRNSSTTQMIQRGNRCTSLRFIKTSGNWKEIRLYWPVHCQTAKHEHRNKDARQSCDCNGNVDYRT